MNRSWIAVAASFILVALTSSASAATLVATNSLWKLWKGNNEASSPTNAWRLAAFNDSSWTLSQAPFYYDADPAPTYTGNTLLSDMRSNYTCIFLRRAFVVTNVASFSTLQLRALCDDGFAVWINGTLVTNYQQTAGNYSFTSVASAGAVEPLQWFGATLVNPAGYLTNGTNLLALQVFNQSITSGDFLIDLEITGALSDPNPPTIATVAPLPGVISGLTQIAVTFNEPVTGVGSADLLINGIPATSVTGFGATYSFTVDQPPVGPVQVGWDPGTTISDFDTPPKTFDMTAPGSTWHYTLTDTIPPSLAALNPAAGAIVSNLGQIEVTFGEPVNGVNAADLLVNGSPAMNLTGSLAGPYVFQFPPVPAGAVQVRWAAGHNIRDLAAPPNSFNGGAWTYSVNPTLILPPVRINEFVSATDSLTGLQDEDAELQDWIELYNQGSSPVNLVGWSLTDARDDPGRWTFPAVTVNAGEYLVVFASGKDRKPVGPGARLHTNFKLNPSGDYLGLFNAESPRRVMTEFAPGFPEQRADYSYGYDSANGLRYFSVPTPNAANGNSVITNVAPPVHFNVERGVYDRPFTLILNTPLAGARIRYTTDGSEPTQGNGLTYASPPTISNTSVLRATAFKSDALPSKTTTHTYLFLDQVIRQPNNPPGFPVGPAVMAGYPSDYEMDPEVVTNSLYRDLLKSALTALPVLSIGCKVDDLFGPVNGIYTHPTSRGPSWEKPCSAEFFFPDGGGGFQTDCGIQVQGNAARDPQRQPKHPLRLVFKGDYGPSRLDFPLFPDSPVTSFDTLVLRADYNNSWTHWDTTQRRQAQRTRDAWMKDTMRAMGGLTSHNRYVHLYLNGLYWGIYDPTERPDAAFAASYLGGGKEDYDVVNEGAAVDGNLTGYNAMLALTGLATNSQYDLMRQSLDIQQFIDYTLLHFYVGHQDWGFNKNWYTMRDRTRPGGFKYVPWDGENILQSAADDRVSNADVPSGLHTKLVANAEYRLAFADRVQKHLFNAGALTTNTVIARWLKRAAEVDLAVIAESARWGDYRRDVHQYSNGPYELYTRNNQWLSEQNRLLTQYFPARGTTVLNQLAAAGLYPAVAAPSFNQQGGQVAAGFSLSMTAPAGTIYYTTNGADPRVYGTGAVSPSARSYSAGVLLNVTVTVKARASNGGTWSALNEASFAVASLGVPLRFTEIMYNPVGGDPYEFIEIQNTGGTVVNAGGFFLEGVSYVFPPATLLAPGQVIVLASALSPGSFATRYPGVTVFGYFGGTLGNGGERLVLRDAQGQVVVSADYSDRNGWPLEADGIGPSLEVVDPLGDPDDPVNWRSSAASNGSPGSLTASPALGTVRLNEIMADNVSSLANGATFPDWIELRNTGGASTNLAGWSLTDDSDPRKFVFPPGTSLPAGGYLVVWCDADVAAPGIHTGFALSRTGESLFLYDPSTNRADAVSLGLQLPDRTVGRVGVGDGIWQLCQPTPAGANVAAPLASATNLVINEWLANAAPGNDDWIELHNRDVTRPVALQGLHLTTSNALFRILSLSYVRAGGFVQLHADEAPGSDHVDFALAGTSGMIALYDTAAVEIDRVIYGIQAEGVSRGRLPDGTGAVVAFPNSPSPGASNYLIAYSGPTLNEVMAWNTGVATNSAGQVMDWIELFNPTAGVIDLAGMSVSDGPGQPGQWMFPSNSVIQSGGYRVIWFDASRPASTIVETDLNTGRSLDRRSGAIYLYNALGQTVDSVDYGFQIENQSMGKSGGSWRLLSSPTPGAVNTGVAALGSTGALKINEWMARPFSGDDWFELYNSAAVPVSLTGLYLSDDLSVSGRTNHQVAPLSFIGARGWVKFVADDQPGTGRDHVSFRLDADGGALWVADPALTVIDAVYFGAQTEGVSSGRLPDGAAVLVDFTTTPSPDASNYLPLPNALINEVLSHTDPPLEDSIELHNPTPSSVDISGWYLSDTAADFKKFQIPAGTILPAGGFRVFYENQINGGAGSVVPFTFDSAHGDEAYLSAADGTGNLTGYRNEVRFGASANGVSFGRYVTSVGEDFVALSGHTFGVASPSTVIEFRSGAGASNAYPLVGPVVISEIMYHPVSGSGTNAFEIPEEEYVELENVSGATIPLYDPLHPTNTWRLGGGIEFVFPANVLLPSQGHLLIVNFDPVTNSVALAAFRARNGVTNTVPILGPFAGRLDNDGDTVGIYKPDPPQGPALPDPGFVPYVLVEGIHYSPDLPWPVAANGSGASLQRLVAVEYGNDPVNWQADAPTAGRANRVAGPNQPPVLAPLANRSIDEGTLLIFTNAATDPDFPTHTLTFSLENAPANAAINAQSGVFTWTPDETQGPGTNAIVVRVTDNGSPALSDAKSFVVTVNEVNSRPVLTPPGDRAALENHPLSFDVAAMDFDQPSNVLTYSLDAPPAGASIDPVTGRFTWTPSEAQGPGVSAISVRVTDGGAFALSDTAIFIVTVNEENSPPRLLTVADQTIVAGDTLRLTLAASDDDVPVNTLTFGLVSGPIGARVDPGTDEVIWTPSTNDVGSSLAFLVSVADDGAPVLGDVASFNVTVTDGAPLRVSVTDVTLNSVTLAWNSTTGKTYRVQYKSQLEDPAWTDLPGDVVAGDVTALKVDNTMGAATHRFYRVGRLDQ